MNLSQTIATCLDGSVNRTAIGFVVFSIALYVVMVAIALMASSQALAKPAPQNLSPRSDQPVELGDVHWERNLDTAVSQSKQKEKPIAILFQEVPG